MGDARLCLDNLISAGQDWVVGTKSGVAVQGLVNLLLEIAIGGTVRLAVGVVSIGVTVCVGVCLLVGGVLKWVTRAVVA